ncbi:TonB-dependent receptor [uncultured Draconibacterium sp.]|uniref:TonB-dependent receptor n=1 Tax=uncultured Draconibacterium sp. TaxID=1573823 RepID=UPI003217D25A
MKLTSFLIFFAVAQVFALNTYAQSARLSLDMKGVTVKDVLFEIEESSEFYFIYSNKLIDVERKLDVNVNNEKIEHVLDQIFEGENVKYTINDRQIILRPEGMQLLKSGDIFRQAQTVTGVVKSETGETLPGVTVLIKGTTVGTITDVDGKYTINVENKTQVLVFSFVGMASQEIVVGDQTEISVVMQSESIGIDEVVAIGYGTIKKSDLTGAVASVQGDNLAKRSTQQLSTAMQGQMAGVQITRSSGAPGASATVRVRGITTLSNNDPLVIVDGVPSSLNDVVTADVETMTVLKDAASAAIYGSRAAAGVILITTKRAKQNQFSFDYNYEYAIDKPTAQPKNGDVIDWMNIQNEVKWNDGASDPYSQYSQETINSWLSNNATDPWHYPNTDWVDLLLKKTTSHEQHTLSVTGGTEKLRTKSTFNYQKGNGYYMNKSYERFSGRINNDYQITDWLSANFDLDFSKSTSVSPSQINAIYWAYLIAPYYPAFWEDGRYADTKDGGNALAALEQGRTNDVDYYKFGGKAQFDVTPMEGLKLTAIFAPRYTFTKGKRFTRAVPLYYENGSTIFMQSHRVTSLDESRNDNNSFTYQFYGNYQKKLGDHSFSAMVGYEGFSYKWENLGASRTNYLLDTYPYLNIGPEDYQYNSGKAGHNAYQSVFGRLMYSFRNKYMLQGNVRSDGSSRFSKDYRWGTFYSASAGWVMSEESWFKNDVVDYLKLRGSVGQLGNERIGSEFPYQAAMNFGNSYMYDKASSTVTAVQNAAQYYYAFEDITWETTTTYGGGLDFHLFENRLRFAGDYYYKKTSNMLLELGFPSYAGFSAPQQNAGDMHTRGWDLELSWADNLGDFWYNVSANLSDYRSKMGYLGDKRTINGNQIYEEGSYFNEWFMYKTDGLFQTDADLYDAEGNKYPTLTANDKAGNIKYVDTDGNGTINSDDKVLLGNSLPEYLYGGNIAMGWKGFDFNLSFQGIGHQRVLFNSAWIQPLKEQWGAVPELLLGDYWSQHNTEEQNLEAKYPRLTYTNTTNTYSGSDYWLFNGGYFRVKNITLGYTLPNDLMRKVKVKDMRLYLSVNDLPAISNFPNGWDPEVGSSSDFISTSFILGVNVKF